jgi:hypothetical protein
MGSDGIGLPGRGGEGSTAGYGALSTSMLTAHVPLMPRPGGTCAAQWRNHNLVLTHKRARNKHARSQWHAIGAHMTRCTVYRLDVPAHPSHPVRRRLPRSHPTAAAAHAARAPVAPAPKYRSNPIRCCSFRFGSLAPNDRCGLSLHNRRKQRPRPENRMGRQERGGAAKCHRRIAVRYAGSAAWRAPARKPRRRSAG